MMFHAMTSAACFGQEAAEAQPSTQRMGGTWQATPGQGVLVRPRPVMWPLAHLSMPRAVDMCTDQLKAHEDQAASKRGCTCLALSIFLAPGGAVADAHVQVRTSHPESSLISFVFLSG